MTTTFPPAGVPGEGELLLITDELSSPADFLLHRLLISRVKDAQLPLQCVVLAVSESIAKWKTISAKSVRTPLSFFVFVVLDCLLSARTSICLNALKRARWS